MILSLLTLELVVHALDLGVVSLKLPDDHLLVNSLLEAIFDLLEVLHNLWKLFSVGFLGLRFLEKESRLFP